MNIKYAETALDTYLLTDEFDTLVYGCGLPAEFCEYMLYAWKYQISHANMLMPTGRELIDLALHNILSGFENKEHVQEYLDDDLVNFDLYGHQIESNLLRQAMKIKWN